ncbi:hypothetical protein M3M38_04665 [Fructilactobacillus cliffordii]|uniref:hypothetical protein n=1 Tax=Fructilactobacillus cliffordii TaxID=2940299 RepID=UPI002093C3A2|nr:hypothetical protein [Fructilactobacillus cliffordii]USS86001.1 hypothetical protein M3M38_04665 [Fructilactobacillus cliffordii]
MNKQQTAAALIEGYLHQQHINPAAIVDLARAYQGQYSQLPDYTTTQKWLTKLFQNPVVWQPALFVIEMEHAASNFPPVLAAVPKEELWQPQLLQIAGVNGTIGISNYFEIKLNQQALIQLYLPTPHPLAMALSAALSGQLAQWDS